MVRPHVGRTTEAGLGTTHRSREEGVLDVPETRDGGHSDSVVVDGPRVVNDPNSTCSVVLNVSRHQSPGVRPDHGH